MPAAPHQFEPKPPGLIGVKLPSNLQGLFEVRYHGDTLDADATIRLLEAMREMKGLPLPTSITL